MVAAAGNEGTSQPIYPAADDNVVAVSAVDINGTRASYSSYGDFVDVAAPGGDTTADLDGDGYGDGILSTLGSERRRTGEIEMTYGFYEGTSMAAPHVAGVAALMLSLWPEMTPDDFDQLLAGGALTTRMDNVTYYGAGLIDAYKTVQTAQASYVPAMLSVSPDQVEMGIALTTATLTVEKSGESGEALDLIKVSTDASWLRVTADSVDANGLGAYTASVDRTGLVNGTYSGTIHFVSSENTISVTVNMQVNTIDADTEGGYHYIRLVDTDTGAARYETGAEIVDGRYVFSFSSVVAGTYRLIAGTDLDRDGAVDDAGEITGAYPSLDSPATITVDGDISGLDFVTTFNFTPTESDATLSKRGRRLRN